MEEQTKKRLMNKWVFADQATNISNQVYAIGDRYAKRLDNPKKRPKRTNGYGTCLIRYFYFLYLTGSRLMEPVMSPPPQITLVNEKDNVHVEISKINEKHKAMDGQGREIMEQALPIFNAAEQHMWNYITEGGEITNAKSIFHFDEWESTTKGNLSHLLKSNFRTNLKDELGVVHKDCGITPHILRHMRAYNVIVNYGVDPSLAITWFGWKDQRMLYYYANLRRNLRIKGQMDMLKRGGFLTDLRIDLGKAIPGY